MPAVGAAIRITTNATGVWNQNSRLATAATTGSGNKHHHRHLPS